MNKPEVLFKDGEYRVVRKTEKEPADNIYLNFIVEKRVGEDSLGNESWIPEFSFHDLVIKSKHEERFFVKGESIIFLFNAIDTFYRKLRTAENRLNEYRDAFPEGKSNLQEITEKTELGGDSGELC